MLDENLVMAAVADVPPLTIIHGTVVCKALGYKNTSKTINDHVDTEDRAQIDPPTERLAVDFGFSKEMIKLFINKVKPDEFKMGAG